jgi:uncharacterized protein YggE
MYKTRFAFVLASILTQANGMQAIAQLPASGYYSSQSRAEPPISEVRMVTTVADGDVTTTAPDTATLFVSFSSRGSTFKEAEEAGKEGVSKVGTIASKYDAKVVPAYNEIFSSRPGSSKFKSAAAESSRRTLVQKMRVQLPTAGETQNLVDDLLKVPDVQVESIGFEFLKLAEYQNQAVAKGVATARSRAEYLASQQGQKLGKPYRLSETLSISDGNGFLPILQGATNGSIGPQVGYYHVGSRISPVALHSHIVRARVTATFQLLDN